jgi:hypothetical protein
LRATGAVIRVIRVILATGCCLVAASAQAATLYVDGSIAPASCSNYNVATRTCGSGTSTAYKTLAGAAGVTNPGDIVEIRGGTYNVAVDTSTTLSRSGSASSPITYRGYQSEQVVFKGTYDVDSDGDGIRNWDEAAGGDAAGPSSGDRGIAIEITGNYIRLSKVRIQWVYACLSVTGNNNIVEEVVAHECWEGGLVVSQGDNNTLRHNAAYRIRHRGGIGVNTPASSPSTTSGNVLYRNLSWKNGRQLPNDAKVLPFTGDPDGGGNSDGMSASKECVDSLGNPGSDLSLCNNLTYQENIAWRNTDDCYDTSIGNSWVINNIGYDCGPNARVGWKILRANRGYVFSGNILLGTGSSDSLDWGTRVRFNDTNNTGTNSYIVHGISKGTFSQPGFLISEAADSTRCFLRNNVAWDNSSDFSEAQPCTNSNNYAGGTTDPQLANPTFSPVTTVATAETCLASAPHAVTVKSCWQALYDGFFNAYKPAAGSALIDAGVFISGYHCATADDSGSPPPVDAACRHWRGSAPDQGPFEFGINGNPDRTRCAAVGGCAPQGSAPQAPSQVRIIR